MVTDRGQSLVRQMVKTNIEVAQVSIRIGRSSASLYAVWQMVVVVISQDIVALCETV